MALLDRKTIILLGVGMIICGISFSAEGRSQKKIPFPFTKGASWIYKGYALSTQEGGGPKIDYLVCDEVKIVSLDSFKNHGLNVALLDGFPTHIDYDQSYYAGEMTPITKSDPIHTLVVLQKDGSYIITTKDADVMFTKLRQSKKPDDLINELDNEDISFKNPPLSLGYKFGEDEKRDDSRYCWVVSKISNILDVDTLHDTYRSYTFSFDTNPDHTEIEFVPEMGITKYEYVHHGTIMEEHIELVQYKRK